MSWNFTTSLERFEVPGQEAAWQHVVIPTHVMEAIQLTRAKRFVITLNGRTSWHCAINITCEADHQEQGIPFCYVARQHLKSAGCSPGDLVEVTLKVDDSKYGMNVHPDLAQMLTEDSTFQAAFDGMLPGQRRRHLLNINKAKSPMTVAKRIGLLMNELGLSLCMAIVFMSGIQALGQEPTSPIRLGNERTEVYLPLLQGKRVGVVGNHTSHIGGRPEATHLVDTLLSMQVDVTCVFAPEHGFRGEAANGAHIRDGVDLATGLPILSLHGSHRKPQPEDMSELDVVVFDIQDVGARFYTYVSTMMLVMEACAEQNVRFVILDRPNPHGHHMEGPMLDSNFQSFVGWIPTPMVHGMTLGELAHMGSQLNWIQAPAEWRPTVVACEGWKHGADYELEIPPSPNLPTTASIDLYPSLCLFEPTVVSVGRGTSTPFELLGHPDLIQGPCTFTPIPIVGAAPHPKHEGEICYGQNLVGLSEEWRMTSQKASGTALPGFDLNMLWNWAELWRSGHEGSLDGFITSPGFFDKLAGTDAIRKALEKGAPLAELRATWSLELELFFHLAKPFFIYPWDSEVPGDG